MKELAELLVGRSLGVRPGWQVMIQSTALARPLVEELVRAIARRGAYPLVRLSFTDLERVPFETVWAEEAPEDLIEVPASIDVRTRKEVDARVVVFSAENVFAGSELPAERRLPERNPPYVLHEGAIEVGESLEIAFRMARRQTCAGARRRGHVAVAGPQALPRAAGGFEQQGVGLLLVPLESGLRSIQPK